jgi:hypothetical protein
MAHHLHIEACPTTRRGREPALTTLSEIPLFIFTTYIILELMLSCINGTSDMPKYLICNIQYFDI